MEAPKKLIESEHYGWLLKAIKTSSNVKQIRDALEFEKGLKVSMPTLRQFITWSQNQPGGPETLLKENTREARQGNDALNKYLPKDKISLVSRRVKIIKELNKRISLLKDCQSKRGDASKKIFDMISDIEQDVNKLGLEDSVKNVLSTKLKSLKYSFNYKADILSIKSDIESILLRYYSELHENYKYIESFIDKYELNDLVEKVVSECVDVSLGNFIRFVPDGDREATMLKFKDDIVSKLKEIQANDLLIKDE